MSRIPRNVAVFSLLRRLGASSVIGIMATTSVAFAEPSATKSFSVRIVAREDETGTKQPITKNQVAQCISTTKKRLEALGLPQPQISESDSDGFQVHIKGLKPDQVTDIAAAIQKIGKLELKEVCPRTNELDPDGKTLARRVLDRAEIVPGYKAVSYTIKDKDGKETKEPVLVNRRTAITNVDIASARPSPQYKDQLAVDVVLNEAGAKKMFDFTKTMTPGKDRIAVMLDDEVVSAPVVMSVPLGKSFVVDGLRTPSEAKTLTVAFLNPLEVQLIVKEEPTDSVPPKTK